MPSMDPNSPDLATKLRHEPAHTTHFPRRDSPSLDSHIVITEEDESAETASEPAEPTTPTSHTSDAAPFAHPFRHDEPTDSVFVISTPSAKGSNPKMLPHAPSPGSPVRNVTAAPAPVTRIKSNSKMNAHSEQPLHDMEKPLGLGKRVGSFVRNKLHRTPSHMDGPAQLNGHNNKSKDVRDQVKHEKPEVMTGVDGPAETSIPAVSVPRYRRLNSFSLSTRTSPKGSQANSPPSPGSPASTASDEKIKMKPKLRQKLSSSSTALSSMNKQRPGISWANTSSKGGKHSWSRRRSASTDTVPQPEAEEESTAGMISTYSKHAAQGVGMKARRMSLTLPAEFVVDCCDLDKEYKSSSLMPGKRGKCLGKGATAEVRIMARKGFSNEELVAVKEFRGRDKGESEEDYITKIKSEYSIAKSLHHPNIVETVRLCTNRGRWNHVMEFCAHGELFSLVERKLFSAGTTSYYTLDDRLCFFKQLLRGVDYLHSHGIAHRDIKLENLLLHKDGYLKISDFGVAEVFSGEHPGVRTAGGECGKNMGEVRLSAPGICGSLPYIAPEVLDKKGSYDPRPLDVWSCAIVYLTMTFGGCPWEAARSDFEYYAKFKKGWDNWLKEHPDGKIVDGPDGHPKCGKLFSLITPPAFKRLILKMLHPIPEMRITVRALLESSFIKGTECCCPENHQDPKCCVDASKATRATQAGPTKTFLHHHVPPRSENKLARAFSHRFDLGDGYQ